MKPKTKNCVTCRKQKVIGEFTRKTKGRQNRCKDCYSLYSIARKRKIGEEDYYLMLESQGGLCLICRESPFKSGGNSKYKRLHIDHCHKGMNVRGLLCNPCNRTVGFLENLPHEETKPILCNVERYLRKKPHSKIDPSRVHPKSNQTVIPYRNDTSKICSGIFGCGSLLPLDAFYPFRRLKRKGKTVFYSAECKKCNTKKHFWSKYRLTMEEYVGLLSAYNHECYICSSSNRISVDHCTERRVIRGILCNRCNFTLLPAFDREHVNLEEMVEKLESYIDAY